MQINEPNRSTLPCSVMWFWQSFPTIWNHLKPKEDDWKKTYHKRLLCQKDWCSESDARGKFGDHESSITIAWDEAESNSSLFSALQASQVRQ